MKNPFDPEKDHLNYQIFEKNYSYQFFKRIEDEIKKNILNDVNKHIQEKNPELLTNFTDIYKELTLMIKEHEKTIKMIEKKSKKLFESSTLTEDVYLVRDEIKILKKKIDKLNSGLRGFARLGDLISEEK